MKRLILTLAIVAAGLTASQAHAQFLVRGPDGSLGIRNGCGTYTYIYPERLNPAANTAQPGTYQNTPYGDTWVGMDGMVHGNFVNPETGNVHVRSARNGGQHYSTGNGNSQRRTTSRQYSTPPNRRSGW
jgi:hypothetical protein